MQAKAPAHTSTRSRLLDAAEKLFAERGIDRTSLRAITRAARANLAAVHYHFGSKEALTEEVFRRRLEPLNAERLRLLDAAEARAGGGAPELEAILEAFLAPPLRWRARHGVNGRRFVRLMGRMYSEPGATFHGLIVRHFGEVLRRFLDALQKALPHLAAEEILWRLHFTVGGLAHALVDPGRLAELTGGLCDPGDEEAVLRELVAYAAAGFRAPSARGRRANTRRKRPKAAKGAGR